MIVKYYIDIATSCSHCSLYARKERVHAGSSGRDVVTMKKNLYSRLHVVCIGSNFLRTFVQVSAYGTSE